MKKIFALSVLLCGVLTAWAADKVTFTISDGIENQSVKAKMERTVSAILTEANAAQEQGRALNFAGLGVPASTQGSIEALWDNSPFVCMDDEIVEHCITTGSGYQIRNIPLLLKPLNTGDVAEDEDYQEAVISFDKQGNLTTFYLSISMNLYMNVVRDNKEITDLRRRQLILDYVEQFRTSYNQKDIKFLEDVFSEDALIITGVVQRRRTGDGIKRPDVVKYTKETKSQYLTKLKSMFARKRHIRVTFDQIEVIRHPSNKDFYGVTLHQGWTTDGYHDDGYVFLLWDFRNESAPQIHVRTWQPNAYDKDGSGVKPLPKDEIFNLSDFDI